MGSKVVHVKNSQYPYFIGSYPDGAQIFIDGLFPHFIGFDITSFVDIWSGLYPHFIGNRTKL